ncbi:uncharacterized protein LOC119879413 [Canis lupus familiaris]|uniref:uncharacterized protein LOC119879413 n=1 Tax=Canis lupus familiaris TaxID=9615 RepID=UPI0018F6819A|nr:uncharacterized protein LOC119879413 [Canis lupus familiaris]
MELLSNYPALKKHLDWLLGGSRASGEGAGSLLAAAASQPPTRRSGLSATDARKLRSRRLTPTRRLGARPRPRPAEPMAGREEPRGGANVPEAEFPKGQRVSGLGGLDSTKGRGRSACRGRLQLTAPSSSGLSQVPAHQPLRHKPGGSGSSHLARTFPTLVWAFRTTKQCEAMVFTGPLRYSTEDWQLENRSKGTTHYGLLASGRGARGCDFRC